MTDREPTIDTAAAEAWARDRDDRDERAAAAQQTYRGILEPLFGAAALAEAERRTYRLREWPEPGIARYYACEDGRCAMAVVARAAGRALRPSAVGYDPHFPPIWALTDKPLLGPVGDAITAIIAANDYGWLATPGALTALLDRPFCPDEEY